MARRLEDAKAHPVNQLVSTAYGLPPGYARFQRAGVIRVATIRPPTFNGLPLTANRLLPAAYCL